MSYRPSELTKVVFRVFDDEVIALFPDIPWNEVGDITSYVHNGQHGAATYGYVIQNSRPAKPDEYSKLKAELESLGYLLRIVSRARCVHK